MVVEPLFRSKSLPILSRVALKAFERTVFRTNSGVGMDATPLEVGLEKELNRWDLTLGPREFQDTYMSLRVNRETEGKILGFRKEPYSNSSFDVGLNFHAEFQAEAAFLRRTRLDSPIVVYYGIFLHQPTPTCHSIDTYEGPELASDVDVEMIGINDVRRNSFSATRLFLRPCDDAFREYIVSEIDAAEQLGLKGEAIDALFKTYDEAAEAWENLHHSHPCGNVVMSCDDICSSVSRYLAK